MLLAKFSFLTELFLGMGALCIGILIGVTIKWRQQFIIPADTVIKQCRNCRWCRKPLTSGYSFAKCLHPSSVRLRGDMLASGVYHRDNMHYCSIMRTDYDKTHCGEEAQFWEAKK